MQLEGSGVAITPVDVSTRAPNFPLTDTYARVTIGDVTPLPMLRTLREARDWSRETLAEKSGTSAMTVLRAELHDANPSISTVAAWAHALGVSVSDLMGDGEPETAA